MKIDLKNIPSLITAQLIKVKGYIGFIIIVVALLSYSFLIYQIRNYALDSPDDSMVTAELQALNIPKVDEEAIERIEQLESTNVEVKALFKEARSNPFQE